MEIKVKPWSNYYDVTIKTQSASIKDEMLTQAEVDYIAAEFVEATILYKCSRGRVIQRLLDVGLIDVELMKEYLNDMYQTDFDEFMKTKCKLEIYD